MTNKISITKILKIKTLGFLSFIGNLDLRFWI